MRVLLSLIVFVSFFLPVAQAMQTDIDGLSQQEYVQIKNFMNGKTIPEASSCRPDGYTCTGSYECCGHCMDGVCKYGGGGGCYPDGAVCTASYECCGTCTDGTCTHGGGGSCRPDGLRCSYSFECCGGCYEGVCKYGN